MTVGDKTVKVQIISPEIQQIREELNQLNLWVRETPLDAIQWMVDWCISTGKGEEVLEVAEWLQRQV